MLMYNIEITKQSRFKQFRKQLRQNIEDKFFNLLIKVPDKLLPAAAIKWISNYLYKRNQQLKVQATQLNFNNTYLLQAVNDINIKKSDQSLYK